MPKFVSIIEGVDPKVEFAAKVTSIASAYLLETKTHNNGRRTHSGISAQMICAMMMEINDPCICKEIEESLMTAVEENQLSFTTVRGMKVFFLPEVTT